MPKELSNKPYLEPLDQQLTRTPQVTNGNTFPPLFEDLIAQVSPNSTYRTFLQIATVDKQLANAYLKTVPQKFLWLDPEVDKTIQQFVAILDKPHDKNLLWFPKCLFAIYHFLEHQDTYEALKVLTHSLQRMNGTLLKDVTDDLQLGTLQMDELSKKLRFEFLAAALKVTPTSDPFYNIIKNQLSLFRLKYHSFKNQEIQEIEDITRKIQKETCADLLARISEHLSPEDLSNLLALSLAMLSLMSLNIDNEYSKLPVDEVTAKYLKSELYKIMSNTTEHQLILAGIHRVLNTRSDLLAATQKTHTKKLTWGDQKRADKYQNPSIEKYRRNFHEFGLMHPTKTYWSINIFRNQKTKIIQSLSIPKNTCCFILNYLSRSSSWKLHQLKNVNGKIEHSIMSIDCFKTIANLNRLLLSRNNVLDYDNLSVHSKRYVISTIHALTRGMIERPRWILEITCYKDEDEAYAHINQSKQDFQVDQVIILNYTNANWKIYFSVVKNFEVYFGSALLDDRNSEQLSEHLLDDNDVLLDVIPDETRQLLIPIIESATKYPIDFQKWYPKQVLEDQLNALNNEFDDDSIPSQKEAKENQTPRFLNLGF